MYTILEKKRLTESVTWMTILAPEITRHAMPGQFVMLRVEKDGERIPMTIAASNQDQGTITIIFQVVGTTTRLLNELNIGDEVIDFVGPLGKRTEINHLNKVLVVGGGVGCAIAYPIVKALHDQHKIVDSVIGFKTKDAVFIDDLFEKYSNQSLLYTNDGTKGLKGFVTEGVKKLINDDIYDEVIVIGPLLMMKAVSELTKEKHIKTIVSLNPIMIDGTGMCGGCRVLVNDEVKFACVDGPEFDGHLVHFDELIRRNLMYHEHERKTYDALCKLLEEKER
ncbi:MAG: ferredoxin-NADP reductase [Tenericutes bacterium HGW-Tenericutes-6]|nr:MAG: ferredoxin-NADP reductase [Tenericutes bacterium HGW-Tenericutes-6]